MSTVKEMIERDSEPVTTGNVALVLDTAKQLFNLGLDIEELEASLKLKQAQYFKLSTETLPDLMDSEGVSSPLGLKNGFLLEVSDVIRASIPAESTIEKAEPGEREILEERRVAGLTWLRKNKAGDIIKDTLKIEIGRGGGTIIRKFLELAKAQKVPITRSETVHPGTLGKLLKEKLAKGVVVPVDTFGLFRGRQAKIVAPKTKKEGK